MSYRKLWKNELLVSKFKLVEDLDERISQDQRNLSNEEYRFKHLDQILIIIIFKQEQNMECSELKFG